MVRLQGDFAKPPEKRFNYKHCFDALFRVSHLYFPYGATPYIGKFGYNRKSSPLSLRLTLSRPVHSSLTLVSLNMVYHRWSVKKVFLLWPEG